jgi:glycerol-3-phosphate dehydrogenase (NAD(P)+)
VSFPIAIIGAGGWGTALAITMARREGGGRDVRLWAFEPYLVETMIATRENQIYLPSVRIPESVCVSNSMKDVLSGARIVMVAVPSHVYRQVIAQALPLLHPEMLFVSAAKGIENDTLMRMSEVVIDVLGARFTPQVAAMSGPTFAPEVARGEPTALVVASPDEKLRQMLQNELSAPGFRLYTNDRRGRQKHHRDCSRCGGRPRLGIEPYSSFDHARASGDHAPGARLWWPSRDALRPRRSGRPGAHVLR